MSRKTKLTKTKTESELKKIKENIKQVHKTNFSNVFKNKFKIQIIIKTTQ